MNVRPTTLDGVMLVHTERFDDHRGYFARAHCASDFSNDGIPGSFVQSNLSYNRRAGTFRGLHFQIPPSREGKLVRCVRGAIFDVIVDLRPNSQTFLTYEWFELDSENLDAVYIPSGCAHGFLTDADDSLVHYEMTDSYAPELARGVRWSDPLFGISLPRDIAVIEERDAGYPDADVADFACFERTIGT